MLPLCASVLRIIQNAVPSDDLEFEKSAQSRVRRARTAPALASRRATVAPRLSTLELGPRRRPPPLLPVHSGERPRPSAAAPVPVGFARSYVASSHFAHRTTVAVAVSADGVVLVARSFYRVFRSRPLVFSVFKISRLNQVLLLLPLRCPVRLCVCVYYSIVDCYC